MASRTVVVESGDSSAPSPRWPAGRSAESADVSCGAAPHCGSISDDLFDLLGERPELLRQLFEGMFRMRGAAQATPA